MDLNVRMHKVRGRVELRSWFRFEGNKAIGMGTKITRNERGEIVDIEHCETGCVAIFPEQERPTPWWKRFLAMLRPARSA